jgi:hypothetical protein
VESLVWLGLAVLVLAFLGGIALVVVQALAAYRTAKAAGGELVAGLDRVLADSERLTAKLEGLAPRTQRLQAALDRLSVSRARLNVLLQAISQVRAALGRVTGVVPRKS